MKEKDNRAILAIDSGVSGTGYAVFPYNEYIPVSTGNIYPSVRIKNWVDRMYYVGTKVGEIIQEHEVKALYIEWPEQWEGHAISRAITQNKNIFKLAAMVGDIHRVLMDDFEYNAQPGTKRPEFIPINPYEWKGQLSKEEVTRRVKNIIGPIRDRAHAIDAIGIGLWARGLI